MRKLILPGLLLVVAVIGAAYWFLSSAPAEPPEPGPDDIARAAELRPEDPEIAAIYERACIACHSVVEAQAPLAGHKAAWDQRIRERGLHGLLISARNGRANMPAMGMCLDCSDEDFTALIAFMSGTED